MSNQDVLFLIIEVVQKCKDIEPIECVGEEATEVTNFWFKLTEIICKVFQGEMVAITTD